MSEAGTPETFHHEPASRRYPDYRRSITSQHATANDQRTMRCGGLDFASIEKP